MPMHKMAGRLLLTPPPPAPASTEGRTMMTAMRAPAMPAASPSSESTATTALAAGSEGPSSPSLPSSSPHTLFSDRESESATLHHLVLLNSCLQHGRDPGAVAFVAYDTCGPTSPIRNCAPGKALILGVVQTFLGLPVSEDTALAQRIRDGLRNDLLSPVVGSAFWAKVGGVREGLPCMKRGLMCRSMKAMVKEFFGRLPGPPRDPSRPGADRDAKIQRMRRGKGFLTDVMAQGGSSVGTDVFRDAALESLRKNWGSGGALTQAGGWDMVRFPIVFHLQWDTELTRTGKVRMLFHTVFDPWRAAVGLAMALCSPHPPIQVRETPYRDARCTHPYQPPRKYIIDWDLFVEENLGRAGRIDTFTEEYLFNMFVRSLGVIHAYMRRLKVSLEA